MVASALFISSLAILASAKPASKRDAFVLHSERTTIPSGFTHKGSASTSQSLVFRVGLAQKNVSGLESVLYAVSTPSSPSYGQHLTVDQLNDYLAPTEDTANAVSDWLSENGIEFKQASPSGDWINFTATVEQANKLFNTEYQLYTNTAGDRYTRVLNYSLPSSLAQHIDVVHPTNTFETTWGGPLYKTPVSRPSSTNSSSITSRTVPSSCASDITPSCLQALYGIPTTPATQSSNQIAIAGFLNEYPQIDDLATFAESFRPDITSISYGLVEIDGGEDPQSASDAGVEANLDLQYTFGIATNVPDVFVSVGPNSQTDLGGFLDITNYLIGESPRPQVVTTSYGEGESGMTSAMATRLCNAYMSLGALGTSVIFASGDSGVGSDCTTFAPSFPSGCPYVTSVGATSGVSPEVAASFSSGGFSNLFSIPSYQSSAVSSYKSKLGSEYSGLYNTSGRGFPDVSAQGNDVEIVNGGGYYLVGGTSCSSPIFTSIIALINDKLIAAGKSPLGFLNPFLYENSGAFTDITSGSNPGCNTNGFPATSGWDPVTGLGTPKYASLLAAAGV